MDTLQRSFNSITMVPVKTALYEKGCIFVKGEINNEAANEFVESLGYLSMTAPDKPIKIIINSPGGEIEAGLMMCDALEGCAAPTEVYCLGHAYSMAAILFESCPGKRYMVGHSKLMLHQPSIMGNLGRRTASEVETISKQLKQDGKELLQIVSKRSGMSLKNLIRETREDRYYDADEAIKAGLADEIVTFTKVFESEEK